MPLWLKARNVQGFNTRQRLTQTLVWSCEVVVGLIEGDATAQLGAVLAEAEALASERRQRMAQSQIEPFDEAGADLESQSGQAFGTDTDSSGHTLKSALFFVLDQLGIDQVRMSFFDWVCGLKR